MSNISFEEHSVEIKSALNEAIIAFLYEAAGEIEASVKRNQTRVATSQTKNNWQYIVDENQLNAIIGNPLENAIWEEFGTGEYALNGNGRKGGWHYKDSKGKWHSTKGKKPLRAFQRAYDSLKNKIIRRAEQVIGGNMS